MGTPETLTGEGWGEQYSSGPHLGKVDRYGNVTVQQTWDQIPASVYSSCDFGKLS